MSDEPTEWRGTKAGRNEGRKLVAALMNALSAASFLAAIFQPALAIIGGTRSATLRDDLTLLVFGLLGITLHMVAQRVARRLED